tara:strand:- start:4 stop:693 length:690 start_codon:yes stop_codon:yes gene_type:complete
MEQILLSPENLHQNGGLKMLSLIVRFSLLVLLALFPFVGAQSEPKDWSLIGLKFGQDIETANDIIGNYRDDLFIRKHEIAFTYSDGVQMVKTDPFLSHLEAAARDPQETLKIYFSAPPREQRLIAVTRVLVPSNPPTREQFLAALTSRFGEPSIAYEPPRHSMSAPLRIKYVWINDHVKDCYQMKNTDRVLRGPSGALGELAIYRRLAQQGRAPSSLARISHEGIKESG